MPDEHYRRKTSWSGLKERSTRFFHAAWTYVASLALVLIALVAALLLQRVDLPDWRIVALLAMLAVLGEWNNLAGSGGTSISLTASMLAASCALTGPVGAAVVGVAAYLLVPVSRPLVVRAFNSVMTGLLGGLGGLIYLGVGGRILVVHPMTVAELILHSLLPLLAAMVGVFVLNMLIVGGMISLTSGASMWQALSRTISSSWLSYLGSAIIGFLFAVLWGPSGLELVSVLIMIAPLLLAQWSLSQRHAEREAHRRTIEALVAAVEARDPIMRGHSARVAAVAALVGDVLRLAPRHTEALQFAALLHDIGLVGPRSRDAERHTEFTVAERERIRQHPTRGVEMLREIDFLSDAVVAIRHHHERWDGQGFPQGLARGDIPRLSRIIAVADAYCALTTPRADHEAHSTQEALSVLRQRAGSQFDPACVEAMVRLAPRLQRLTEQALSDASAPTASGLDHDLPSVSDAMITGRPVQA